MITDDLRNYLREGMKQGYTPDVLSLELRKAGWSSEDVELALQELSATPAAKIEEPKLDVVSVAPEQTTKQETLQPIVSGLTPIIERQPSEVASAMPSAVSNTVSSKSNKIFIILGVVLFLLVATGSAAAYFLILKKDPLPEVVFANMQHAMKNIHSYAFETKLNVHLTAVPEGDLLLAADSYLGKGTEGTLNLNTTATGTIVMGESATSSQIDASYDLAGNASYGAFSLNLDGAMNIRVVDGVVYVRALKLPQLLMMSEVGAALTPWQEKWIVIDPSATSTFMSSIVSEKNNVASGTPVLSKEEREKMQNIVERNWPVELHVINEKKAPIVGGVEMYHYEFALNKEKLTTLLTEAAAEGQAKRDVPADPTVLKEGIDTIVSAFASSTGELFIGKKDSLLYRMNVRLPVSIATSSVRLSGAIDISFDGSHFNAVAPVVAPTPVTTLEEVVQSVMGEQQSKLRDAKRVSDIAQIQLALELYFDAHGKYPIALNLLVKEHFLSSLPTDPASEGSYVYHQLKTGKSYVLGASIENEKNKVLSGDADMLDSIVHGDDTLGCSKEEGRHCYDVAP